MYLVVNDESSGNGKTIIIMTTAKNIFQLGLYAAFILLVLAVTRETVLVGNNLDRTVSLAQTTLQKTNATLDDVHSSVALVQDTLQKEALSFDDQKKEFAKTQRSLRAAIDYTNKSLNEPVVGLLPQTAATVAQIGKDSSATFDGLNKSTVDLDAAIKDFDTQVSAPEIHQTLVGMDQTSANLAETTKHLDSVTAMGEAEVKRLTKPASLSKTVFLNLIDFAAKAGSFASGFFK